MDKDQNIYAWWKHDEEWNSDLGMYSTHLQRTNVSAMFWDCLTITEVGTLTHVDVDID